MKSAAIALSILVVGVCLLAGCSPSKLTSKAKESFAAKDCEDVEKYLNKVIKKEAATSETYYLLSQCEELHRNLDKALVYADLAVELKRGSRRELREYRARLFVAKAENASDPNDKLTFLDNANKDHPSHLPILTMRSGVLLTLADIAYVNKDLDAAKRFLDQAILDNSGLDAAKRLRAKVHFDLGFIADAADDLYAALRYYNKALADNETFTKVFTHRADVLFRTGRHLYRQADLDSALVALDWALKDNLDHSEARLLRGEVHLELGNRAHKEGRYQLAISHYDQSLLDHPKLDTVLPNRAKSYLELSELALARRQYTEAYTLLNSALHSDPDLEPAQEFRAEVYHHLAGFQETIGEYEAMLAYADSAQAFALMHELDDAKIRKTRAKAYYEVAMIEVLERGDFDQGFAHLDSASVDYPLLEPMINIRRGELHAQRLDFEQAIVYTERAYHATEADSTTGLAIYNLARYNALAGNYSDAIGHITEFYYLPHLYPEYLTKARTEGDLYYLFSNLEFQLWLEKKKRMEITLIGASGISCEDPWLFEECDAYARIKGHRTPYIQDSNYPSWGSKFVLDFPVEEHTYVEVMDSDSDEHDRVGVMVIQAGTVLNARRTRDPIKQGRYTNGYLDYQLRPVAISRAISTPRFDAPAPSVELILSALFRCTTKTLILNEIGVVPLKAVTSSVIDEYFFGKTYTPEQVVIKMGEIATLKALIPGPFQPVYTVIKTLDCIDKATTE